MKKLLILGLSVLLFTACGNDTVAKETPTTETSTPVEETATEEVQATDEKPTNEEHKFLGLESEDVLSIDEVVNLFNSTFSGANIEQIELEYERDLAQYDVQGFSDTMEYELKLDATTGEILYQEEEQDNDREEILITENILTIEDIVDKAQANQPGISIESITLDMENGQPVTVPSSPTSPSSTVRDRRPCAPASRAAADSTAHTMAKSNADPCLRRLAGDMLTTTFVFGQVSPEFRAAVRTRSRASATAASPNPPMCMPGRPRPTSASTSTVVPSTPCSDTDNALPTVIYATSRNHSTASSPPTGATSTTSKRTSP